MNTTSLITVALLIGVLTSCTTTAPSQPPPRPSPTCTPEAGGPGTPCTQYQYDQMIAKDKLYTEAETVYRKFLAEDERIYRAGGITTPSPVLLETTTGDYLKNSMEIYRELHRKRATATGGAFTIAWFHRVPGESLNGSEIALEVCTDSSNVAMGTKSAKPAPGLILEETGYLIREGGKLKLTSSQYEEVDRC